MKRCVICEDNYTTKRRQVRCDACSHSACIDCVHRYLLASNNKMDCMFCHTRWDIVRLYQNISSSFLRKKWIPHWKEYLYRRESSFFQEMMPQVQHRLRIRDMKIKIAEKKKELIELEKELKQIEHEQTPIHHFHIPCPNAGCHGYVDRQDRCILCLTRICHRCRMVMTDGHRCRDVDLLNQQIIHETTRPCPKCRVPIQRESGCYQMWCTQCHALFDWNKNTLIKEEIIHNPHYLQFIQCADDHNKLQFYSANEKKRWISFFQMRNHVRHVEMPRLMTIRSNNIMSELRISLMMNDISMEKFKDAIFKEDMRQQQTTCLLNMWNSFMMSGDELMHAEEDRILLLYRLLLLIENVNNRISQINETFKSRIRTIIL